MLRTLMSMPPLIPTLRCSAAETLAPNSCPKPVARHESTIKAGFGEDDNSRHPTRADPTEAADAAQQAAQFTACFASKVTKDQARQGSWS